MKVKDSNYADYKTARQWAKKGYLPVSGATGVELWANAYCQDSYTYYAPNEVAAAAPEQIKEFFAPEREQRNKKAKEQRQQRKEQKQKAEEQRKKQEQQVSNRTGSCSIFAADCRAAPDYLANLKEQSEPRRERLLCD